MHILNVNSLIDPLSGGGTAERTIQISRSLIANGIKCSVMTSNIGFESGRLVGLDNIPIIAYKCINKRFHIPLVRYRKIKEIIRKVDVVHLMGHWSILNILVYIAVRSLGKPYVVCPAGALPLFGRSKLFKKLYNFSFGNNIIKNASAWIAVTEAEKDQFLPYGIARDKISVIPNGINPDDFYYNDIKKFKNKFVINNDKFIMFVGRLNKIKGPDILLNAFIKGEKIWADWDLIYAGPDGGLLHSLKKMVADNNLSKRVRFIGYINGDEKSSAYHAADLLVIPSRQEAMSIVVLEAGITSTPVVITDQCGFNQVEMVSGGLICQANVNGIYSAIYDAYHERNKLHVMGKNLNKFVNETYTWSVVICKYIDLYLKLLNKV